jgi:type II secretory ATPase GspE/PulE/Tfp pilus assembly ATPase PilB-like protein
LLRFLWYNRSMRDIKSLQSLIESQFGESLDNVSVIKLVDLFVEYAYSAGASDIHIEPTRKMLRVRYRIDGLLYDSFQDLTIKKELNPEIVSRIKVQSGLRTDEHLLPQDGRFRVKIDEETDVDVRVSIIPTYYGENVIMRVLAETHVFDINNFGFSEPDLKKILNAISRPYGMIIANGPTGSGKTTLLYTLLKQLNKSESSIITIEDPIEYSLDGTTQIQTNSAAGLTFATGLRSILRQDPNIIMVGEIRDEETASISVNAALTGHLVLSTIHTNDAATTFPRLLDMGVPSFLVASTVNIAISQRLVRKLCQFCKVERILSPEEVKSLNELFPNIGIGIKFYAPKGCAECNNSGYKGRLAIHEVLEVKEEIRKLIMAHASAQDIKDAAIRGGMTTMLQDSLANAARGLTSIEEILRIISE